MRWLKKNATRLLSRVEGPAGSIQIEVHFDFDLNGILTVTTTEKERDNRELVVNNAGIQRLSSQN